VLHIEPIRWPADKPLVDDLTLRMTRALREASKPSSGYLGVHTCICGAVSDSTDRILPGGARTNTLCVHYLAYHRAEVPAADLDAVRQLPASADPPSSRELAAPKHRSRVDWLVLRLDADIHQERDPGEDTIRWRYELLLDNRAKVAARVTDASFALALDGAYAQEHRVEAGWTLARGEVRRLPHTATFRVADFREDRSPAIAASLSTASRPAVNWRFRGTYADGEDLDRAIVVA
jgi:hypothetical protein